MSQGNYQSAAQNGPAGAADVTPELHIKMSKKIAQLTKVWWNLACETQLKNT